MFIIKQPGANESPDSGQGGLVVVNNQNTSHDATTSAASRNTTGTTTQLKTCRWSAVPAIVGQIKSIDLKWDWVVSGGSVDASTNDIGDSADATITFKVDYSINNGGSWT